MIDNIELKQTAPEFDEELRDEALDREATVPSSAMCGTQCIGMVPAEAL